MGRMSGIRAKETRSWRATAFVLTAMFNVLLSLFTEETKRDTSDRIPLLQLGTEKIDNGCFSTLPDAWGHWHQHYGRNQNTTMNVREGGATPLVTLLSTTTGSSYLFQKL